MPRFGPQLNEVTELYPGPQVRRGRSFYLKQTSYRFKPEWPKKPVSNPYELRLNRANTDMDWQPWKNGADPRLDVPNIIGANPQHIGFPNAALYARAYTSFMEKSRDGSAEVGLNLVQRRKTLSMLVHYASLLKNAIYAVKVPHLRWLSQHRGTTPQKVRRQTTRLQKRLVALNGVYVPVGSRRWKQHREEVQRVQRKITWLQEISGALLAFRYGVLPLMSDTANTAKILSEKPRETVSIRKGATRNFAIRSGIYGGHTTASGRESCVLRADCSVSNPNLFMANRLGLLNVAYWVWDSTPWSFVIDWFFNVSAFLNNFTASVGLSFTGASITHSAFVNGTAEKQRMGGSTGFDSGTWTAKFKKRSVGSLPIPRTVPFGTGLGLERGQNAVALLIQRLIPSLRKSKS